MSDAGQETPRPKRKAAPRKKAPGPRPAVRPRPEPEPPGIECPACGCRHFFVVYVRPRRSMIVRRRECRHCGRRITTRERAG